MTGLYQLQLLDVGEFGAGRLAEDEVAQEQRVAEAARVIVVLQLVVVQVPVARMTSRAPMPCR